MNRQMIPGADGVDFLDGPGLDVVDDDTRGFSELDGDVELLPVCCKCETVRITRCGFSPADPCKPSDF